MDLSLRLDTLGMVEVRYLRCMLFFLCLPLLPSLPSLFLYIPPLKGMQC